MPSIELVSVGQRESPTLPFLPFAIKFESKLASYRFPSPLFQIDFDATTGWIYHLGNPKCADIEYRGLFFAYELLDRRDKDNAGKCRLLFASEFRPGVEILLRLLLDLSPVGRVLFTSDWQFGPKTPVWSEPISLEEFWEQHDMGQLRLNALYPVNRHAEPEVAPDCGGIT